MRFPKRLPLTFIALPLLLAQMPAGDDEYWPKEIDTDNIHLVLYQPQVESWKGNRIEARSAVIVTLKGDSTQIFGTRRYKNPKWLSANFHEFARRLRFCDARARVV
jgi:hypothetical protein